MIVSCADLRCKYRNDKGKCRCKKLINDIEMFLNQECLEEEDYITEIYYILNKLKELYDKTNK